jgi:very-short-patch-repair endonuclease
MYSLLGMQEVLPYIPYKGTNKHRAKENRQSMTRAEKIIRFDVLQYRPQGYKFIRQKMIGSFILDFYCSKLLLGIEIDGSSHIGKEIYDQRREEIIRHKGVKIVRYTNREVYYKLSSLSDDLIHQILVREQELEK